MPYLPLDPFSMLTFVPIFWVFMDKGREQDVSEAVAYQALKILYLVPDLDASSHGLLAAISAIFIFPSPELPFWGFLAVAIL